MEQVMSDEIINHKAVVYEIPDIISDTIIVWNQRSAELSHLHIYRIWDFFEKQFALSPFAASLDAEKY